MLLSPAPARCSGREVASTFSGAARGPASLGDTGAAFTAASVIGFSPALASAASALARNAGASSSLVAHASDADFTSPRAICQASCFELRAVSRATKIVADSRWRVNAT